MEFYHNKITGEFLIDHGTRQFKIKLAKELEFEEISYIISTDTFRSIIEQLLKGDK